jgi:TolA-binding protein
MSDPARLLSGEADDFEKQLLGSWGTEQPSDAARARVLAIAGVGAVAGGAAVAAKVGAAAGGSLVPKAGAAGAVAITKWIVICAIGVATAGVTYQYARRAGHETTVPSAAPTTVGGATAPLPSPAAAPATLPRAEDTTAVTPATQEPSPRSATSPRHASGADKRSSDPALGEQVSALDRARRALGDGDSAGALRQLDDYESRFPRGALVEEAEVLRVESLLASGDRASAARVGGRFLAAHPDSPHAARVRALLGQAPGP